MAPVAPAVIKARTSGTRTLAQRLAEKAGAAARAAAENRLRARRADPSRWRSARLIWPLFTKD